MPTSHEDDIEAQVRAEEIARLQSALTIYRRRGQMDEALRTAEALVRLDPGDLSARELRADLLVEEDRLEEALSEYRAILKDEPGREYAERMIATISLSLAERERVQAQQRDVLEQPEKMPRDRTARAVTCALLLPGLAQLYLGRYLRGVILMLVSLVAVAFLADYAIARPFTTGYKAGSVGDIAGTIVEYPFLVKFLLVFSVVVILAAYLYGLIDAVVVARRERQAVEDELGIS